MATPSQLLKLLDTNLIAELIDIRRPGPRKGLELFAGAVRRRDNQFKVKYDMLTGAVRQAPLTSPKAPSVPVPLEELKQYGVTPASVRIHHCIYEHDKIDMRAPGGQDTTRWGDDINEWVSDILGERMQVTKEILIWDALGGGITYSSAQTKLQFAINYNVKASHLETLAGGAKWDAPTTCDPIGDIEKWLAIFEQDSGYLPDVMVMNRFTLRKMMAAAKFVEMFANKDNPALDNFTAHLRTVCPGLRLEVYQGIYKDEAGTVQYVIKDGDVRMFNTEQALSIEEVAAAENKTGSGRYPAGPFAYNVVLDDPMGVKVIAGENYLPVVTNPDTVMKHKVY